MPAGPRSIPNIALEKTRLDTILIRLDGLFWPRKVVLGREIPLLPLNAIMLASPGAAPPSLLSTDPVASTKIPSRPLPIGMDQATSVPMLLPITKVPGEPPVGSGNGL